MIEALKGVHPHLVKVVEKAWADGVRFRVVQGLRSELDEARLVASHKSRTMKSRHLPNRSGFGCAVDLAALSADGALDWAKGREAERYGELAKGIKKAGVGLGVPVLWGGDWKSWQDWDHFELPEELYP